MAIPNEPTLRRGAAALAEVRFTFIDEVTPALERVDRAFIGLAFVLACMPCRPRALTEGQS